MEIIKTKFKIEKTFAYSGGDQNGEPIGIHIIQSGWRKPVMYHVLIEHGDIERTDLHLLTREQIQEKFDIAFDEGADLGKMVRDIPNDMELGKAIRLEYIKNKS
jgi:hypothetical protein